MLQRTIYKQQITTTLAGVRDFIIALRLVRDQSYWVKREINILTLS